MRKRGLRLMVIYRGHIIRNVHFTGTDEMEIFARHGGYFGFVLNCFPLLKLCVRPLLSFDFCLLFSFAKHIHMYTANVCMHILPLRGIK